PRNKRIKLLIASLILISSERTATNRLSITATDRKQAEKMEAELTPPLSTPCIGNEIQSSAFTAASQALRGVEPIHA
ncbi:MAG: hypothetical protein ACPGVM_10230, partial [Prochlorococcaceae cyanobacterium]